MSKYQNATIYFMSGTGNPFRVTTWAEEEFKNHDMNIEIISFEKAKPNTGIYPGDKTIMGHILPTHGFIAPWVMISFGLNLPAGEGAQAIISPLTL